MLSFKNQFDMNWWRSVFRSWARCIGLFSLLWSAKTHLKVRDTSISMISFHKLTFWLWFNFIISCYARHGDCRSTLNLVLAFLFSIQHKVKNSWLKLLRHDNLSIFEKLWQYFYKYEEIFKISLNLVCHEEKL